MKREELLQFAQSAISGLKISADLGRWVRIELFCSLPLDIYFYSFCVSVMLYYLSPLFYSNYAYLVDLAALGIKNLF